MVREYIDFATDLLLRAQGEADPNACFVLSPTAVNADTYAGTEPVGFTVVEPHRADSVRVALYQSPDASYYAVLKVGHGTLEGRGRSRGFADAAVSPPQDSIRARRIGPPDRSLCIRAAEAEAAALEARRHPPQP
jgi:hypothetical protein